MNYALDAIWWKLSHPKVRDLASLLTAPALLHSQYELAVKTLLGEQGFRYLLDLDKNPQVLEYFLQEHNQSRLGYYAESLLSFWFQNAPHAQLFAQNLILQQQTTLGELDFIVQLNQTVYHIELCCKYYGAKDYEESHFHGINPHDKLIHKARILQQQRQRINHPLAQDWLKDHHLHNIQTVFITRGMIFTTGFYQHYQYLNPYTWRAVYGFHPDMILKTYPNIQYYRFHILDKMAYLSPFLSQNTPINLGEVYSQKPCLIAQCEKRNDGYWHEIQRYFHYENEKNN